MFNEFAKKWGDIYVASSAEEASRLFFDQCGLEAPSPAAMLPDGQALAIKEHDTGEGPRSCAEWASISAPGWLCATEF